MNKRGFTLLEILMAMAIFAIVISTIFGTYSAAFRVQRIAESQGKIYRKARIAMERILEDIAAIQTAENTAATAGQGQPSSAGAFIGEDGRINDRDADALRFTSRAHLVFSGREDGFVTAEIAYTVREDDRGLGLQLLRADRPVLVEESGIGSDGLVLCDGLRGVDFSYLDADGTEMDSWDSTAYDMQQRQGADRLPTMISIRLEFDNEEVPEQPLRFTTKAIIPVRSAP